MSHLLEMRNISKDYPGVKVLDDISFSAEGGEVLALMGENGAGKSTLMKILMGIAQADRGEIFLEGNKEQFQSPKAAMDKGIIMIHQELNVLLDMEVSENIFLGREIKKKGMLARVDMDEQRKQAQTFLDSVGIKIDAKDLMRNLSVAQMQLIEIVKAISVHAKVIIMDEPTSAITEAEAAILFEQIEKLKKAGVLIIYISHKMDEIFKISDKIAVLRDGHLIRVDETKKFTEEDLIRAMVGRELQDVYPKKSNHPGKVLFEVENLASGKYVKDVSFQIREGEVVGFAGLVGSGRSETMEALFGVSPREKGKLRINGAEIEIHNPKDAIRHKIAFATEDRKRSGLNLIGSIKENVTMVSLAEKVSKHGIIQEKKEGEVTEQYIKKLRIKTPNGDELVGNLSGGNQQKVVLAKWLLGEPEIIIFDEPTRGIDVGAKHEIYELINALSEQKKAIIVISSEMPELMGICDRLYVMSEGYITGELNKDEFNQEAIMRLASARKGGMTQ